MRPGATLAIAPKVADRVVNGKALADESALTSTPRLHKVLTVVCFLLLVGLLVECMAMFPAILLRFGWS